MNLKSKWVRSLVSGLISKFLRKKLRSKNLNFFIDELSIDDGGSENVHVCFRGVLIMNKAELENVIFKEVVK